MARFEGTHRETLTVQAPLTAAHAHFGNLQTIIDASSDVESAAIEGDTIHFVLKEQNHGITTFQGRYSCRYEIDGTTVRWQTVGEGNTDQSGTASFHAVDDDTTRIEYEETLRIDLNVPDMMAPMLQPVIGQVLAHELGGFVKRMVKAL